MASAIKLPSRRARFRAACSALLDHFLRIRYRLLLVNVLVVSVPIIGISFARTFEREMLQALESDMIHQAQLLRAALLDDPSGLRLAQRSPMLAEAARYTRTRIRLLDTGGRVVADSHHRGAPEGAEKPAPSMLGLSSEPYHAPEQPVPVDVAERREVRMALAGQYGAATRLWQSQERVYLFSALPIYLPMLSPSAPQIAGVIYVTRSTGPVKFAMYRLRTWLFWILAAALFTTAVLSLFLAATIARPLGRLTRIAKRIAAGDRGHRLTLHRRDEIGELARAFDTMTQRLDDRARETSELAANISHEFKSPLTSIRGAAELLRDGAADDMPARHKFLQNIIEDTHRLDRLVTRLLELSRFEADTAPRAYFDYEALVREVMDQREDTSDIPIELSYHSKTTQLRGRRHHLASLLGNLLDNALQHASPGTAVKIIVADGPRDMIRTTVVNRGPVISDAIMERIWDRFFTTRAKQGGTGLGLAIVASIIKAHGGVAAATSSEADGTAFSIDLPRS